MSPPHAGPESSPPEHPSSRGSSTDRTARGVQASAIGVEFAASALGGLFLGYVLDEKLGTGPWLVLLGTLGGFVSAVYRTLVLLRRFDRIRSEGERNA